MSHADRNFSVVEGPIFEISEAFGGESEPGNGRPVGPATPPAPASRVLLLPPRGVLSGLGGPASEEKKARGRCGHVSASNRGFSEPEIVRIRAGG